MPDNDKTIEPCLVCEGTVHAAGYPEYVYCAHCFYRCRSRLEHNRNCELKRLGELVEKVIENPPWDKHIDQQSRVFNEGVQAMLDPLTLPVEVKDEGK